MKFTWFNLMPWPLSAGRFPGEEPFGLGRHRSAPVRSGKSARGLQHLSRSSGICRRWASTAIGVNEHHQNGYGIMPSPNLIAAALARRTKDVGARRARQFHRALQSAGARGRGVRDAGLHLGRAAGGGLSGRHLDGHELLLRPDPGAHAREIQRSARSHHARRGRTRSVRVQRPLQQAAPCQHLAAPDPAAASADPYSRRRLRRDL